MQSRRFPLLTTVYQVVYEGLPVSEFIKRI